MLVIAKLMSYAEAREGENEGGQDGVYMTGLSHSKVALESRNHGISSWPMYPVGITIVSVAIDYHDGL